MHDATTTITIGFASDACATSPTAAYIECQYCGYSGGNCACYATKTAATERDDLKKLIPWKTRPEPGRSLPERQLGQARRGMGSSRTTDRRLMSRPPMRGGNRG